MLFCQKFLPFYWIAVQLGTFGRNDLTKTCCLHVTVVHGLQILERETSREKNLEKAMKEAKIRAKREATKGSEDTKKDASEQEIKQVSCCRQSPPLHSHQPTKLCAKMFSWQWYLITSLLSCRRLQAGSSIL